LDISNKDIILLIGGAIISAIVFFILAPFVEKPINNFLVRILNKTRISYLFRPKTSIEGLWKQKWVIGQFLTALGFDWSKDENSQNTPHRVAKAWVNDLISDTNTKKPKITT